METDFLRYSCQMALPGFNEAKQRQLQQAKVLIIGAGGLGCPVSIYLTAAGVGTIGIADFDTISVTNLHRQVLYTPMEVGLKKATVACNKLQEQNPEINLCPHIGRITSANVLDLIKRYQLVIDCTDNFETKYLINDACVIAKIPLIFGAIYQYDGQVAVWNVRNYDGTFSPNYRDLFPEVDGLVVPNCAEGGVIPTLAGIIGCMQANEAIKWITQTGELLKGKVLIMDAQTLASRIINIGAVSKTNITEIIPTTQIPEITVSELKICLRNNTVTLVDVRNKDERNAYNIGGIHIPLQEIEHNFSYLNAGKTIVMYCASGNRSADAVKSVLKKYPYTKIFSLAGGIKAWSESIKSH